MNLTPRLDKISKEIPSCECIADVGTDHAYLVINLLDSGKINRAIVSDVVDGPVNNAKKTVKKFGYSEVVDVRKGSGFEPYKIGEVNGAVIAGMGGTLIVEIIDAHLKFAQSLDFMILQPMVASDTLRKYLENNNFQIVDEFIEIEGNRIYEILKVKTGYMKIQNPLQYELGVFLPHKNDEKVKRFFKSKIDKYQRIYDSINKNSSEDNLKTLSEISDKISAIKELI